MDDFDETGQMPSDSLCNPPRNLASPSVWSANSHAPIVIGGQNVVINPISGAQKFFRLKSQ